MLYIVARGIDWRNCHSAAWAELALLPVVVPAAMVVFVGIPYSIVLAYQGKLADVASLFRDWPAIAMRHYSAAPKTWTITSLILVALLWTIYGRYAVHYYDRGGTEFVRVDDRLFQSVTYRPVGDCPDEAQRPGGAVNTPSPAIERVQTMTTKIARAPRRKPFIPSGTPWQQDKWTREIERQLIREAKQVRRTAARLERLSERIAADRTAGCPIDPYRLGDAVNADVAPYAVRKLVGVELGAPRMAIFDAIFQIKERSVPRAQAAAVQPASDALMQATAIARSASGDIDWTREPLTERERKIRRAMLNKRLHEHSPRLSVGLLLPYAQRRSAAQDWREAFAEAEAIQARHDAERAGNELREAIKAVDGDDDDADEEG